MKRLAFVLLAAAALAPAALAKGPSAARITGPGLDRALAVKGTEMSGALGDLTQYGGFFPAAFGQQPSPMLARRPANLGPRYTIHYVVPGDRVYHLTQDLYPYARGGAVTYMKPDQAIFGMGSRGGWYRGGVDRSGKRRRLSAGPLGAILPVSAQDRAQGPELPCDGEHHAGHPGLCDGQLV